MDSTYPNGYSVNTITINGLTIAIATPSRTKRDMEGGIVAVSGDPPHVYLVDKGKIKQNFEINLFSVFPEITQFEASDIDNDSIPEIITQWYEHSGASNSFQGIIVWKLISGELTPHFGLPAELSQDDPIKLIAKEVDGNTWTFPVVNGNDYVDYNYSPTLKLSYGEFVWDIFEGETLLSPHVWKLSVYKLERDQFLRDQTWNNGKTYITKEKISFVGERFQKFISIFTKLYEN